jgi:hypothetical protein
MWSSIVSLSRFKTILEMVVIASGLITAVAAIGIWLVSNKLDQLKGIEEAAKAAKAAETEKALADLQQKTQDRRLTPEQSATLKRLLDVGPKGKIVIICASNNPESQQYAADFDAVFRSAGWASRVQDVMTFGGSDKGLFLDIKDSKAAPLYTETLFKALLEAGLQVQPRTSLMVIDEPVNLVVGHKP